MHQPYKEITSRLGEPLWWDEHAVPRYQPFEPGLCANVYAEQVALVEIACQDCGRRFLVAMSHAPWYNSPQLCARITDDTLHYGDPPNYGCCPAGPMMNCDDIRVVEFWRRSDFDWARVPELELPLQRSEAKR